MAVTLTRAAPGQIDAIHEHMAKGHEMVVVTYTQRTKLTKRHIDYIRADGEGYRLGWPGKRSDYTPAYQVYFVPAGYRI